MVVLENTPQTSLTKRQITLTLRDLVKRYKGEGTATEIAYASLRHAIIDGLLTPGMRLRADELATKMGFSRTPIREAFNKLEAHELVEMQARNGLVVREFTEQELLEIYYIRIALEGMAAQLAAENISKAELTELGQIIRKMETAMEASKHEEFRRFTIVFHQSFNRASRNQRLAAMLDNLQEMVARFHPSTFTLSGRTEMTLAGHKELLSALEARDPIAAEEIARRYRRETMDLRIRLFQEIHQPGETVAV